MTDPNGTPNPRPSGRGACQSTMFMEMEIVDEIEAGHVAEPTVVATQMGVGAFGAAGTRQFASRPARLLVEVEPTRADCINTSVEAGKITTISEPQDSIMAGLSCGTLPDWRACSCMPRVSVLALRTTSSSSPPKASPIRSPTGRSSAEIIGTDS